MTIKEVEIQSGMTRANIRFYESEGLLSPARSANGYRDYSSGDLEVLKRIRLLRTLHLSLPKSKPSAGASLSCPMLLSVSWTRWSRSGTSWKMPARSASSCRRTASGMTHWTPSIT